MVAGVAGAAALLWGCSDGKDGAGTIAAATTAPPSTNTSSSTSSTTTAAPSRTTVTSRPPTTVAASSPERAAKSLYEAWAAGDRAAAQTVAQPEAVATLFARPWQATDGWSFADCTGAAGSLICTWQRPGGQELLFRIPNVTGGPVAVSEVRFQP